MVLADRRGSRGSRGHSGTHLSDMCAGHTASAASEPGLSGAKIRHSGKDARDPFLVPCLGAPAPTLPCRRL